MKINSINNQNFGKIYIDDEIKPVLMKDILRNPVHNAQALREAFACLIEVAESKNRDIFINKKGEVLYRQKPRTKLYQDMSGYSVAGKLIHSLGRIRSKNLQKEISKINGIGKY